MIDGCGLPDVELVEVARGIVLAQRPRVVVVAVDQQRLPVQGAGAIEQVRLGGRGRHREHHQCAKDRETGHGGHVTDDYRYGSECRLDWSDFPY